MRNKSLSFIFPLVIIMALLLSLVGTRTVLADDSTPPAPTEAPSEEMPPADDNENAPSEDSSPTEDDANDPSVEEIPSPEESADDSLIENTTENSESSETPVMEETIPEILEQLPDETEIVILDESGEPMPMATNEAAAAYVAGDPQWCPTGVTPGTDTLNQCTAAHTSFDDLINDLETNTATYSGPGTIYVAHDYDATTAGDAGNYIVFDYGNVGLTDLVVQGGWDFIQDKVVGTSTIDLDSGLYVEFRNWGGHGNPGSLTLKDLVFENMGGLAIFNVNNATTADITFENVEVRNTYDGAYIQTNGSVEIKNSKFNDTDNNDGATIYADGDVVISNSTFNDNDEGGVYIESYGNVTLTDVWAEMNDDNDGASIYADGDVTVTDSTFKYNYGSGVYIESYGNVTLTDVWAASNDDGDGATIYADGDVTITDSTFKDNYYDGAYIDTCGCGTGNVFVKSSKFLENEDRGLVVYAVGDITVKDIQAELNEVGGVELDNCLDFLSGGVCLNSGPAKITMSGTNIIKNNGSNPNSFINGSVGLWVMSIGDISIEGAKVTGNGAGDIGGGAFIFTENGKSSISNSTFSDNCTTFLCDFLGFGLLTLNFTGSDVTLNGVTANGNGNGDGSTFNSDLGVGALLLNVGGNTFVKNSTFSNNCNVGSCFGGGVLVMSGGDVYFNFVTVDNNGSSTGGGGGGMIMAGGDVDIYCSKFTNHSSGVGLMVEVPSGNTASLNGVTFSGNMTDVVPPASGGTLVENPFDCNPISGGSGKGKTTLPVLPLNIVNVNNGNTVELDCEQYSGTKLILDNGNNLVIPCPMEGSASLTDQSQDDLPGSLPDGTVFQSSFVSAFGDEVTTNGKLDKYVLISFVIPDGVDPSSLVILFWDGTQWVEVKGTFVRNEDGVSYFEAYVDYAGTFVLAQK